MTEIAVLFGLLMGPSLVLYLLRDPLRLLFEPPQGRWVLTAAWLLALWGAIYGLSQPPHRAFVGLGALLGSAAVALVATVLRRDAYNRARGFPEDYETVPSRLTVGRRIWYALLACGLAGAAWFVLSVGETGAPREWHGAITLGALAVGLACAALRGRASDALRAGLGAHPESLAVGEEELPAAHRAK